MSKNEEGGGEPKYRLDIEDEEEMVLLLDALKFAKNNAVADKVSIELGQLRKKALNLEEISAERDME